jgi:hypothetical protein
MGLSLREAPLLVLRGVIETNLTLTRISASSCVIRGFGNLDHLKVLNLGEAVS